MIANQKETTWAFDLDDTLLRNDKLIDEMLNNLSVLITKKLNKAILPANETRDKLHKIYGSTIFGLQKEYNIPIKESLAFVHNLSYKEHLTPDYGIINLLKILKGNKIVFTNGPKSHADKSLALLGIKDLISEVITCEDFSYKFKPSQESFEVLLNSKYIINTENIYMVDDQAQNLEHARKLGFKVILVNKGCLNHNFQLQVNNVTEIKELFY